MTTTDRPAGFTAEAILAEWRHAERERDELDPGSAEWHRADHLVNELRDSYHERVDDESIRYERLENANGGA